MLQVQRIVISRRACLHPARHSGKLFTREFTVRPERMMAFFNV
jgi:hypothetical protein